MRPSAGSGLHVAALAALLVAARQLPPPVPAADAAAGEYEAARLVRSWRLAPGARVYAQPASQLVLTYYSGVPVQSVAAVRRSWLDGFDGDLVVIAGRAYEPLAAAEAARIARAHGREVDADDARSLADAAVRLATAEDLAGSGYDVRPPLPPAGPLERELVVATRAATVRFLEAALRGTLVPGRARFRSWSEFWEFYFFWFSDPATHTGAALNFRPRALRGTVHVLPHGWVVYDCRSRPEAPLVPPAG
jgi:hypothetical protein